MPLVHSQSYRRPWMCSPTDLTFAPNHPAFPLVPAGTPLCCAGEINTSERRTSERRTLILSQTGTGKRTSTLKCHSIIYNHDNSLVHLLPGLHLVKTRAQMEHFVKSKQSHLMSEEPHCKLFYSIGKLVVSFW